MEKLVSVLQCFNIAQHQQHSMLQVSSSVVDVELRHIIMNVMSYGVRFRCAVQQDQGVVCVVKVVVDAYGEVVEVEKQWDGICCDILPYLIPDTSMKTKNINIKKTKNKSLESLLYPVGMCGSEPRLGARGESEGFQGANNYHFILYRQPFRPGGSSRHRLRRGLRFLPRGGCSLDLRFRQW